MNELDKLKEIIAKFDKTTLLTVYIGAIIIEILKNKHPDLENYNNLPLQNQHQIAKEFIDVLFKVICVCSLINSELNKCSGNDNVVVTIPFSLSLPDTEEPTPENVLLKSLIYEYEIDKSIPSFEEITRILKVLEEYKVIKKYKINNVNSNFEIIPYRKNLSLLINSILSLPEEFSQHLVSKIDKIIGYTLEVAKEQTKFEYILKILKELGFSIFEKLKYTEKNGYGYIEFKKRQVRIAKINTKQCKLMRALIKTPGIKTIDLVYNEIKTGKDEEKMQSYFDQIKKQKIKEAVIRNTVKDIHKSIKAEIGGIIKAIKIDSKTRTVTLDESNLFLMKQD
ncbi:MAG: hypothetical protein NC906_01570 [Candidatus Omnitrophica bacterium]|nr:hypothetical protein [Candidatus Omnitrophota bacterium]